MTEREAGSTKQAPWTADTLPRGRHKLPREAVRASQRERLLRAMAELVGERGYEATTVPQVISAARVSSNTFYRFFSDKTDCFIALCEELGDQLFDALTAVANPDNDLPGALDALDQGIDVYLRHWMDRPALARAYFVELPSAGQRALDERERQFARFEAIMRFMGDRARALYPGALPLRDVDVTAANVMTNELVAREVRAGRVARLDEIREDVRYLLIRLLVGDEAARRVTESRRDG